MRRMFFAVALLLGTVFVGAGARADVVYSNLGPGDTFSGGSGAAITSKDGYLAAAMGFAVSGNYNVTQIDVPLFSMASYFGGNNSGATIVSLHEGHPFLGLLGPALGAWQVNSAPDLFVGPLNLTTISGITDVTLAAGHFYFLQVAPGEPDVTVRWPHNVLPTDTANFVSGPIVLTITGAYELGVIGSIRFDNENLMAFRVLGGEIPAPPEPALLTYQFTGQCADCIPVSTDPLVLSTGTASLVVKDNFLPGPIGNPSQFVSFDYHSNIFDFSSSDPGWSLSDDFLVNLAPGGVGDISLAFVHPTLGELVFEARTTEEGQNWCIGVSCVNNADFGNSFSIEVARIPEPASLLLLGVGLFGLCLSRIRFYAGRSSSGRYPAAIAITPCVA